MFGILGQWVLRYKYLIVAIWVIAALWMVTQAPVLKDVAISETSEFLSSNSPSLIAQRAINAAFPEESNQGSAILVFRREGGLTETDNTYARSLLDWLTSSEAPNVIGNVTSVFNRPGTESLFVSPDGSTMLASIGFTTGPYDEASIAAIKTIRSHIVASAPPEGLDVHLTGTTAISSDQRTSLFEGIDRTTLATVILVIIVLLLIYRSPIAATAPLITIGLAYLVARGILGYLAAAGWKISSLVDAFIVVLIFGVGTDYCLFILSRFREELGRRSTRDESIAVTMSAIGAVITASAGTVVVALMLMVTGDFVMLQTMGPAMALAVFLTLLAGLTLTPALVAIIGRSLFWPRHDEIQYEGGRTWQRIAEIATTHSRLVTVVVVLVLLVPYLALPQLNQMFDVLAELPKTTDSVKGFTALSAGFDEGELLPVTVLLSTPQGNILDNLDKVNQVAMSLEAAPEVQKVRLLLNPTGEEQTAALFRVDAQLKRAAEALNPLIEGLDNPQKLVGGSAGTEQGSIGDLRAYLEELGTLSDVTMKPSYAPALAHVKRAEASMTRLTEAGRLAVQLDGMAKQMAQLAQVLASPTPTLSSSGSSSSEDLRNLMSYLAQVGEAYPALVQEPSYQNAVKAAQALNNDLAKAQELLLVTKQLELLAQQLQQLSTALDSPLGALALVSTSGQQVSLLTAYFTDLGKAFPTVAMNPAYQGITTRLAKLEMAGKQMSVNPPADLTAVLKDIKKEIDGLITDTLALRQSFDTQNPSAQFIPQNLQILVAAAQAGTALNPAASAKQLSESLAALAIVVQKQYPTARFMPKDIPLSPEIKKALAEVKQDFVSLQATLERLSEETGAGSPVYFLPRSLVNNEQISNLLSYFLSSDGKSTRLIVLLKARPYSAQANRDVQTLRPKVEEAGRAVGLQAVMGGVPVILEDVQQTLSRDFIKIGFYTIIGVLIVLILLLRSLVAPVYLVLTVLLSYGSTIGLSTLVFQNILGHVGVNYVIPIVVFVLLVALGADYNIFLMSRVREEAEGRGTRAGIRVASAFTGSIITSCGIILAGTFAAMMVAPLQTLFQVGFAVAAGVLVDTFIIRAVLVPAIAAMLGEKNWWPGKVKI